jgi:hypothetical protein
LAGGTENAALDSFAFAGDRRYCAPSLYGKAKSDIVPWLPNLWFRFPLRVLTSSWTIFSPRPGTTLLGGAPLSCTWQITCGSERDRADCGRKFVVNSVIQFVQQHRLMEEPHLG